MDRCDRCCTGRKVSRREREPEDGNDEDRRAGPVGRGRGRVRRARPGGDGSRAAGGPGQPGRGRPDAGRRRAGRDGGGRPGRAFESADQDGAGAGAGLDDHLGYVKGDPAGNGSGNSRNGSYDKTVTTTAGPVRIGVPRDRNGSFEPRIVPKGQRRLGQVDDMILSLYARGMTTRDIQAHLAEVYGAEVSPALISNVTSVVAEEINAWQTRPLEAAYPILSSH